MESIFLLIVLLIPGILMLFYPRLFWEITHFISVKDGEPTDLYIFSTRIGGILYIIIWLIMKFSR